MTNDYFNHANNRIVDNTRATSTQINAIFDEVAAGFDKIPDESSVRGDTTNLATNTGTANALVAALSYTPSLSDGFRVRIRCASANTGDVTLNLNSLGIKQCRTSNLQQIPAGGIVANTIVDFYYDASNDYWVSNQRVVDAGGTDTQLQYNAAGDLAGMDWTYDAGTGTVTAASGNLDIEDGTLITDRHTLDGRQNGISLWQISDSAVAAGTAWKSSDNTTRGFSTRMRLTRASAAALLQTRRSGIRILARMLAI